MTIADGRTLSDVPAFDKHMNRAGDTEYRKVRKKGGGVDEQSARKTWGGLLRGGSSCP